MSVWKYSGNRAGNPLGNERGSTVRILLLVFLLLIALFGYLYFFTELIRPAKETPIKPEPQAALVKKPMPPRPGQVSADKPVESKPAGSAPAAAPEKEKASAAAPAPATAPAAPGPKQEATPAAKGPAERKSPDSSSPKAESVKAAQAPAAPKSAPPPATKPATAAAPTKAAAKSVSAEKKAPPQKEVKKEKKPAEKPREGNYTILAGFYPPGKAVTSLTARLGKNGISPVRKEVVAEEEPMNRLFVGEFSDQAKADPELQKLKKITNDAFIIAEDGGYKLYAGSYLTESRTAFEIKRLSASGINTTIKKTKVKVKMTKVTAGKYATLEEAEKVVSRLKKAGIEAKAIKAGL